ncbi:MAG: TrpR-related protein YerC/YecD [Clostridia bacterium]|nr:TrpR-related protein YerC/YecD [Clostridia bacterium]
MSDPMAIEEQKKQLFAFLASLESAEAVAALLSDLCTDTEIEYMAQRVESARLLLEGATYQQVMDEVNVSSATLSRINRCIKRGQGGYSGYLAAYLKEQKR